MSRRIKAVVTDYIEPDLDWETQQLATLGIDLEARQLRSCGESEQAAATRDADVIVVNMLPITRALVASWRRCALVIRHGIGYDNVDVDALTERGIRFAHVPDYCPQEVAEQAIGLIFALGRKIVFSRRVLEESSRRGSWDFSPVEPIHRMKGRTLGIIGCGRIGSRVYLGLQSFGFNFLVCDPYLTAERVRELGVTLVPQETVFRQSDFITLHTPLNEETRHIVNTASLAQMKAGAFLVNTARAGLVDHEALCHALKSGQLAGAALDVLDPEPPSPDFPLLQFDNVILTPHLSWYSVESGWEIRRSIVEQISRFRDGLEPLHWINKQGLQYREAHT